MRMWMVPPETLCMRHLLGEHGEIHKFLAMCKIADKSGSSKQIRAYRHAETLIRSGMIETICDRAETRHSFLTIEMVKRGYNHQSPFPLNEWHNKVEPIAGSWSVNRYRAEVDLHRRCKECAERFAYYEYQNKGTSGASRAVQVDVS